MLDNERYGETGMQPSHTGRGVDLAAIARGRGVPASRPLLRPVASSTPGCPRCTASPGPVLTVVKVTANQPPVRVPLRDGTHIKNRFREALLGPGAIT